MSAASDKELLAFVRANSRLLVTACEKAACDATSMSRNQWGGDAQFKLQCEAADQFENLGKDLAKAAGIHSR